MEKTLVIIKPGAVARRYWGSILREIERLGEGDLHKGVDIREARMFTFTDALADKFYEEHVGKPFYDGLKAHTTSGPCLALVLEGEDVIKRWRDLMGPTDPRSGMRDEHLRARYGKQLPDNAVHGSDSPEAAEREIALVFGVVLEGQLTAPVGEVDPSGEVLTQLPEFPDKQ